jgi:hypothetical protein
VEFGLSGKLDTPGTFHPLALTGTPSQRPLAASRSQREAASGQRAGL